MKNKKTLALGLLIFSLVLNALKAQTVSTFENLTLSKNTYWDGSKTTPDTLFTSGNAVFPNSYNPMFGGYWQSGWAYSNMQDSTTSGAANLHSAITAIGYNGSVNYAVGQNGAKIILSGTSLHGIVKGCYITNGTYATLSMEQGDAFAKKFGGNSGNDSDWFKLTVRKWYGGVKPNDSVEFYLADYRFSDNSEDYIVKSWKWLDLSGLGSADSLEFSLSSSDVGIYGMNTPPFFCIDNFTAYDAPLIIKNTVEKNNSISLYPNPSKGIVTIDLHELPLKNIQLSVSEISGRSVYVSKLNSDNKIYLDMTSFNRGIYFITITGLDIFEVKKIIIE